MCRAELYAKAASFAALNHNGNTSFWHESPQIGANSLRHFNCAGYDYAVRWRGKGVITITDGREEEHEEIDRIICCKHLESIAYAVVLPALWLRIRFRK